MNDASQPARTDNFFAVLFSKVRSSTVRSLPISRALALLFVWAASASADEPVLHVRARTRIDIQWVERVPGGIRVEGALFDTALEEPIPGRTVAISVDGPHGFYRYAEPTNEEGSFRWRVPLPVGEYRLRLAAGGDDDYAPATVVERTVDVSRRSPTLTLEVPETVSNRSDLLEVIVEARELPDDLAVPHESALPPVPVVLAVSLSAGDRVVARGSTAGGRLELELPVHELGAAGERVTLTARSEPSELRNAAEVSRTVRITTPTRVTLEADRASADAGAVLTLSGELSSDSGPVAGGLVELVATALMPPGKPKRIALAQSGPDGRFRASVRAGELGFGRMAVEAHFPAAGFREAGRAGPVEVQVHAAAFHPSPLYLIPPLLTALVLAGLALARRRPWLALGARLRARARRASPPSGLTEGRTNILRTLRPAHDFGLAGQVCDGATGQAIAGATLVVDVGGQHRSALSDENGRFALEALPAGTLAVEVAALGYVSERFHRIVPHRGELRGARVLLVPIRAQIFAAWDGATRPLVPKPELTALWTPRELLEFVKKSRLVTDDWARLTAAVETICYGPEPPGLEALAEVRRLIEELRARPPS
jgi:Carboxypeptidase regulatory-like domain